MDPRELAERLLEAFKASGEYVEDRGGRLDSVTIDGSFNLKAIATAALRDHVRSTAVWVCDGIWADPARMGGEPCLEGTRLPAAIIADCLHVDNGEDEARWWYEVGDAAIEAVRGWEAVGRPVAPWEASAPEVNDASRG